MECSGSREKWLLEHVGLVLIICLIMYLFHWLFLWNWTELSSTALSLCTTDVLLLAVEGSEHNLFCSQMQSMLGSLGQDLLAQVQG